MIFKNKKFIVVCSSLKIPVDESELVKVYQAITSGSPTILKQGWFNPSFFIGVHEDDEWMREFRESKKYQIRDGEITEYPLYPDLFPEIREEIKRLAGSMEVKKLP